jgi:hypothetical protein
MGWKSPAALCATLTLCTLAASPTAAVPSGKSVLAPDGFEAMRLGKPAEGSGTWLEGTPTPGCMGGYFPERPGPHFIFEHDHLARISIRGVRDIQTARGIHLGSTEDEVRAAYGAALTVTPSASIPPPAKTMTIWFHHHSQGIRFDTDTSGRVVSMIAGTPSIMRGANCP